MESPQKITSPSDKDFKKYQAYFCHCGADSVWVMNFINNLESDKYGLKCAEYERDYLGGQYVFDLFQQFMEYSHFIVVVLSPSFLESGWAMFQLYLAVQYSLDNNEGNIIPLVHKDCDLPPCMKVFEPVYATRKGWEKTFTERLFQPGIKIIIIPLVHKDCDLPPCMKVFEPVYATRKGWEKTFTERLFQPAKRFPKNKGICTRDGRISIDALRTCTTRDVMSEPFLLETCAVLSEHNFNKVKTHHYRRRSKLDFMEERVNSNGNEEGKKFNEESAQVKRESNSKDRIPAVNILHIQANVKPGILSIGQHTKEMRKRTSKERVDAGTILEMEGKIDASSLTVGDKSKAVRKKPENGRDRMEAENLLQIHSGVKENTLQKGEQTRTKRNRASRKRRNADNLLQADVECVCKQNHDHDVIKRSDSHDTSVSDSHKGDPDSGRDRLTECTRLSDGYDNMAGSTSEAHNIECLTPIHSAVEDAMDDGYHSVEQIVHSAKKPYISNNNWNSDGCPDMTKHDTIHLGADQQAEEISVDEKAHLKAVKQPLPSNVLLTRVGECAKEVRERNGLGKRRIDADILLFNEYETVRM